MSVTNNLAPIVLFVYARPDHTKRTIEMLSANVLAEKSDLIVYSDGPANEKDLQQVQNVRTLLKSVEGFKSVTVIERNSNFGLAENIIDGVTDVCNRFGRVIVLEDDIVTSPYFLEFMNDSLDLYADSPKVSGVSGYMFPVNAQLPETFFSSLTSSWGWATWKRAWSRLEKNGALLRQKLLMSKQLNRFDHDGTYPFFDMLSNWCAGKNNSWAIRWYASNFLEGNLTLFPGKSFVVNIGHDGSGVHCGQDNQYETAIRNDKLSVGNISITESAEARREISNFFSKHSKPPPLFRMKNYIKRHFLRIITFF